MALDETDVLHVIDTCDGFLNPFLSASQEQHTHIGIVWCVQMLADVAIRPLWNALIPVRNQTTNMSPGVIQWKLLQIQVNHERSSVCTIT